MSLELHQKYGSKNWQHILLIPKKLHLDCEIYSILYTKVVKSTMRNLLNLNILVSPN